MKMHGIRKRWMLNNVLVVLAVVIICMLVFSFFSALYYYSGIQNSLRTKAKTASDFFANYVSKTYTEYYQSAYRYTESFEEKDKLELQFISSTGRVEASTYGITAGTSPNTPDIKEAITSKKISMWMGKNPDTGERIIAVSSPLKYSNGQVIGVMRYVSSLKKVDKTVVANVLVALGVGALIMILVVITGAYFIKSIVEPIADITKTAKRIADGSYGIQINKQFDDEIGDMIDTINDMSIKISQSEKMKTEFISSVSHELRTPLTAITGWSETLLYDEDIKDDSRRGVGIILKEAKRLTSMVEELLEFTRIEDGRFKLNMEQIDVGVELEESIFTYGELLRQEEIILEYEPYDGELPLVMGDPERLRQVFLNILDNAAKYGRSGKRIIVSIALEQNNVAIKVRDFGPGIPQDELEHVKLKFYKGSSKERGSGIGLAVCEEIVSKHNGQLIIENAEGGGVVVTVKLPVI